MWLAMTEVYEVATFYHHFDVVKEGEAPPPALTVRVCETLSCQMAGADALRGDARGACGARRARHRRAVHRPLRAGARRRRRAQCDRSRDGRRRSIAAVDRRGAPSTATPPYIGYRGNIAPTAAMRYSPSACRQAPGRVGHREHGELVRCAAWAAPAFRPAASGRSCAPSRRRASWRSTSTRASPARSRIATTSSAIRTASSKAC